MANMICLGNIMVYNMTLDNFLILLGANPKLKYSQFQKFGTLDANVYHLSFIKRHDKLST